MSKDVGRSSYTRRILEIVANIRKQRTDIDKVTFYACMCEHNYSIYLPVRLCVFLHMSLHVDSLK